jgi:hypothetical protein
MIQPSRLVDGDFFSSLSRANTERTNAKHHIGSIGSADLAGATVFFLVPVAKQKRPGFDTSRQSIHSPQ